MTTVSFGERLRSFSGHLFLLLWLTVLWCLLWGSFSALTVITGILLGLLVSALFYLPTIELSGRLNLFQLALFFIRIVWDIVVASSHVAKLVLRPRYTPSNAIVRVQLYTRSDLVMAWTSEALSIVPGSIIIDQDRESSTLYVHVIDVHNENDIEKYKSTVLATERRLLLALGTKHEAEQVRQRDRARREMIRTKRKNDRERS